jgi:hypothetical protein
VLAPHEAFSSVHRVKDPHAVRSAVKGTLEMAKGTVRQLIKYYTAPCSAVPTSTTLCSTAQYSTAVDDIFDGDAVDDIKEQGPHES